MKTKFYGASDDQVLLEIDGKTVEQYDGYETKFVFIIGGVLYVYANHFPYLGWIIGAGIVDEEVPIPDDWKITMSISETGYSMALEIETPGKVTIVEVKDDDR